MFCQSTDALMIASILVALEIRTIHKAYIRSVAGKCNLYYFTFPALAKIMMNKFKSHRLYIPLYFLYIAQPEFHQNQGRQALGVG
jgi:hypothetical protein